MLIAAGATFYILLALFPAIGVFVSLYGIVADPSTISGHIAFIDQFLPPAGTEILESQLKRLAAQDTASLSVGFITGLLFSLWSANDGIKALFEAMNVAYDEQEKRSFLRMNAVASASPWAPSSSGPDLRRDRRGAGGDRLSACRAWPRPDRLAALADSSSSSSSRSPSSTARARAGPGALVLGAVAPPYRVSGSSPRSLLLVPAEPGGLQRHLRLARRGDRLADVALDLVDGVPRRRGDQRRDGASDRIRHDRPAPKPIGARGARVADTLGRSLSRKHRRSARS